MEMLQENIVDIFIRYGLFVGAIFQLVCIGAVLLMPDGKSDYFQETDSWSDEEGGGSDSGSPTHTTSPCHSSKGFKVKRDKKKRR